MTLKKITVLSLFPFFLVLYEVALYLSNDAYLPALPRITAEFSTTLAVTQLTLTLWLLGACSFQLLIGPFCDKYGRRPILFTGGLIFIFSLLLCTFSNNIHLFLVSRFLQGASVPTLMIAGYATIHELFGQKQSIKTLSFMNSITVLAPSLGPLLGGLLLYVLNWRWLFGLLVIWAIIPLFFLFKIMPETLTPEKKLPIQPVTILKGYWKIMSSPAFMLNSVISGCTFGAMIAWICASSFLIIVEFHYSLIEYGIIQAVIFGGFILGSRIVHRVIERFPLKNILNVGMILILISSLCMVSLNFVYSTTLWSIIAPMFFLAWGSGLCFAIFNRLAIEGSDAPMGARVAVSAWLITFFAVIGSLIASSFETNSKTFSLAIFCLILVSSFLYLLKAKHDEMISQK